MVLCDVLWHSGASPALRLAATLCWVHKWTKSWGNTFNRDVALWWLMKSRRQWVNTWRAAETLSPLTLMLPDCPWKKSTCECLHNIRKMSTLNRRHHKVSVGGVLEVPTQICCCVIKLGHVTLIDFTSKRIHLTRCYERSLTPWTYSSD